VSGRLKDSRRKIPHVPLDAIQIWHKHDKISPIRNLCEGIIKHRMAATRRRRDHEASPGPKLSFGLLSWGFKPLIEGSRFEQRLHLYLVRGLDSGSSALSPRTSRPLCGRLNVR
jgi:hypothetical protein